MEGEASFDTDALMPFGKQPILAILAATIGVLGWPREVGISKDPQGPRLAQSP